MDSWKRESRTWKGEWKMDGKPALVIIHMQKGIVGKGTYTPTPHEEEIKAIKDSGMIEKQLALIKAFREKKLPVIQNPPSNITKLGSRCFQSTFLSLCLKPPPEIPLSLTRVGISSIIATFLGVKMTVLPQNDNLYLTNA
jgi:hypothetical protein